MPLNQVTKPITKENKKLDSELYIEVMSSVIGKGGDTDTNAAIVGGLIGSIIGFKNLPLDYVRKSISLKFDESYNFMVKRATFYEPRRTLLRALALIKRLQK